MNNGRMISLILAIIIAFSAVPMAYGTGDSADYNYAPIAENIEVKTYKNVAVTGNVSATDPDGESVTFYISEAPKKGELTFSQDGSFQYTPYEEIKGKDCFYYYAVDEKGGVSNEATVKIIIEKQKTEVWYSDLLEDEGHYAALVLAENGVYTGECIGNEYFFGGETAVTKGRFLAMCMKLCGAEAVEGVVETGFSDDGDIPMWVKPYAAAALMTGVIDASQTELNAHTAITKGEAMVILDGVMNITDVICHEEDGVMQAFANLSACNIVGEDAASGVDTELTMAEAAEMLAGAYEILEKR
ncbi:MAG: hypothetical protein E7456_02090 [Ruminococcaceae bacterium]|nr:hypothetical protein [Oscillospiraceae bacterium]